MKQTIFIPLMMLMAMILLFTQAVDAELPEGFEVYFNDAQHSKSNGLDTALVELINSAQVSVAGAFYAIERSVIADAFIEAATRLGNDNVRIITDAHYRGHSGCTRMTDAGLHIIDETCDGWDDDDLNSHHKFCVVDSQIVWTGSYNITNSGTIYNNNNAIKIDCVDLAEAYLTEFNEMWGGTSGPAGNCRFSTNKNTMIDHSYVCSGVDINLYFSPTNESSPDTMYDTMLNLIGSAEETIHFCIFTFTQGGFASKLIQSRDAGVTVRGVMESSQTGSYSVYNMLMNSNMDVKLDNEVTPHANLLHHKYAVFDHSTDNACVVTGSYNWTVAAQTKNDENSIIIHDKSIAKAYYDEWYRAYFGADPGPTDPSIDLKINEEFFEPGNFFLCSASIVNPSDTSLIFDEYIILDIGEEFGEDRFYFWPDWTTQAAGKRIILGGDSTLDQSILQFIVRSDMPTCGPFTIWAGLLTEDGTILGNIDFVNFTFQ
ncbi:hypothetical protein K8T06_00495 [bacterium]|nr:hypothetical protein [bacterium]